MMKMLLLLALSAWAEPMTPLRPCKIGEIMVLDGETYLCIQSGEWRVPALHVAKSAPCSLTSDFSASWSRLPILERIFISVTVIAAILLCAVMIVAMHAKIEITRAKERRNRLA